MKKHELLEKAMRDYPKGTRSKFKGADLSDDSVSSGIFKIDEDGDIQIVEEGTYSFVYASGKWAEILPEERKFIMKSEDGVDLYDGYPFILVKNIPATGNKWKICRDDVKMEVTSFAVTDPQYCKALSTKEAAEKWIEEQNKPRCITIAKDSQYPVEVYEKYIRIKCSPSDNHSDNIIIKSEELEQIYSASISLQTF